MGSNPTLSAKKAFLAFPRQPKTFTKVAENSDFSVPASPLPFAASRAMVWEVVWEQIAWAS